MHLSSSNSGLPRYLGGTTCGSAGNFVVKRGEITAVTASFNSLNFGQRTIELRKEPIIYHHRQQPTYIYQQHCLPTA
jgi:hypothetical protein